MVAPGFIDVNSSLALEGMALGIENMGPCGADGIGVEV